MSTLHKFTSQIAMTPGSWPLDHRSGKTWQISATNEGTAAEVIVEAQTSLDAIGRVHFVFQRQARGRADPAKPNAARKRYGRDDYRVLSLRHPQTGLADLPAAARNPDMSVAGRAAMVDLLTPKYEDVKLGEIIETQAVLPV